MRGYRGLIGSVGLMYPILEVGRFNVQANRGNEYSFDIAEGYYIENSLTLSYTHRLFGDVDAQRHRLEVDIRLRLHRTIAGTTGQARQCRGRGRL